MTRVRERGRARGAGGVRRARPAAGHRRRGRGRDDRLRRERHARPRPRRRRRGGRRRARAQGVGARRRARARPARLRRRRRARSSTCSASASSADYLQTSAVIDADGLVHSAVNDPNAYPGPGTGYRLEGERWEAAAGAAARASTRPRLGTARRRRGEIVVDASARPAEATDPTEVVIAVGPAFADAIRETINGLDHGDVLAAIVDGVARGGCVAAHRAGAARRRRRLHRPRRRPAVRLGRRARDPVEGHGGDPPRRPPAARQPRAVRDVAAVLARELSRDGAERRRLRARAAASAPCRPSSTTSRARS